MDDPPADGGSPPAFKDAAGGVRPVLLARVHMFLTLSTLCLLLR